MSNVFAPSGWKIVEIEKLLSAQSDGKLVHQGWSPQCDSEPAAESEWGVLKTTSIQDGHFLDHHNKRLPTDKKSKDRIEVRSGDLLITNAGPRNRCGVICYVRSTRSKLMLSGKMYRLRFPDNAICPEYIESWLRTSFVQKEINDRKTGISESGLNLTQAKFLTLPIMLSPLAEQKVIADKLDTLLAQVENTKARLERIPNILKTFRQSVLSAAVSGKLTEEWREGSLINESSDDLFNRWLSERLNDFESEESELLKKGKIKKARKFKEPSLPDLETSGVIDIPDLWLCVSVSQFAECLDSQRIPVKKDARVSSSGLYPYFGANGEVDRVDDFIFDDDLVLVTEDETFYGRVKPIAYRYSGKCWVNNHAHVLRARTKEANDYLCYALMYYKVIPWLSGTTGRAKLTQAALNALPIGLPPLVELEEIVRRVEELFAFANSIEQKTNAALERVNNITQSILAKAFRGELTADWRAENPDLISGENSAEALLAKIQAEREKLALEKKAANKTRKKKA